MNRTILNLSVATTLLLSLLALDTVQAQSEVKIITTIESIVSSGIGRSRMLETHSPRDYEDYTTTRTDGTHSDQGSVKRRDIKVDEFSETKLLNFFSLSGINFRNIASNDAVVADRINALLAQGWTLDHVVSGVESSSGEGQGIFVTRYIFRYAME